MKDKEKEEFLKAWLKTLDLTSVAQKELNENKQRIKDIEERIDALELQCLQQNIMK